VGLLERPRLRALAEAAEERIGVGLRTTAALQRSSLVEQEFVQLAGEAEDLALHHMDYFSGRPSELGLERRRRIAQRSRIALKFDPLAGAEAQLLADFAYGKGIPTPTAREPKVQTIIDEAWSDANNEEKLTGFQAQRKLSNELLTAGELFPTLYVAGGKVRVGRLDADLVDAVVPDPEDRLRPLWYVCRVRRYEWDFENDRPKVAQDAIEDGRPKVKYWKHWRNYDDAVAERAQGLVDDGEEALITPVESKIAKGLVFHLAINQTGEELRGNPPWARSLRFFEAMNVLTESHVVMAQGASTFIARRVMKGTPSQVAKAAGSVLSHLSELGSSARLVGERKFPQGEATAAFAPGAQGPPPPGSWWTENDSSKLESLSLQSGAGQMAQTAQIVRAPIAAAAGFGQHYLGDAGNANLATASTLELPATMRIESWQEYARQILVWFTDRAIEAAVKAGRLGGLDNAPGEAPIGEMRLHEAEDRAAMEKRTGLDLSYEFVMPFPGRRQLPEVAALVQGLAASMDPNGVNIPLRRHLLRFAFEQMGIADVGHAVEECVPEGGIPGGIGPQEAPIDPETGEPIAQPAASGGGAGGRPGPGGAKPSTGDAPKGARRQSTPPGERPTSLNALVESAWIPQDAQAALDEFGVGTDELFAQLVGGPASLAALQLASAAANGGAGGDGAG
jgi:hypothetical protein